MTARLPFDRPLSVEPSQADRGLKLAILDGTGRVLAKTLSNRRRDRLVAEAIAAFCNQAPDDAPESRKGDAR